jgi:hypothetical protein
MKKRYNFAVKKTSCGQEKLERPTVEQLYSKSMQMLLPSHILENFEMWDAKEYKERWVIELREKEGLIPRELTGKEDIVLDGYCNPIEMLSHSRRYKQSNEDRHYSNGYDLTLQGVRMVLEQGIFLKE